MRQIVSDGFALKEGAYPLCFINKQQHQVRIYLVKDNLIRVAYAVNDKERQALDQYEHDAEISSIAPITFQLREPSTTEADCYVIQTSSLSVHITTSPFGLTWYDAGDSNTWFAKDLAFRSYCHDPIHGTRWHYQQQPAKAYLYGLGERTGRLNLAGRRFRLERTDPMGYDSEHQDPLYKFSPFYLGLSLSNESKCARAYGIYYHQLGQTTMDLGQERDAMWGNFSYYAVEGGGPLLYTMMYGPSVPEVIRTLHEHLGGYRLMPRSLFGYLASAMGYAESDNAQEQLEKFVTNCRQVYDIPCDGMHLSSGYTVDEQTGDRCVFTWNKSRFPDPARLANVYKENGMRLFANIKPWLLKTHPEYDHLAKQHGLVWQPDEFNHSLEGNPATLWQWRAGANTKGLASYIDFTSKAGYEFWQEKASSTLLQFGFDLWLDNNEFTMMDDAQTFKNEIEWTQYPPNMVSDYNLSTATSTQSGSHGIAQGPTPVQTALMVQASYDAVRKHRPNERICLVTRSTVPYTQRLVAHTWSGDNVTAWKTIAFNTSMGTGACLSGLPAGYGHDIGGFAGPKCTPEMLVRWVQQGVLWTRMCIHSFKPDGQITEPWMYSETLPTIRASLKWRYSWIPHLYSMYATSAVRGMEPVVRPTFYNHQHDPKTFEQDFEFMLGPDVLVAPVFEPGAVDRTLYLPDHSTGWFHYPSGQWYAGAKSATVASSLTDPLAPMFVKAGSFLTFGKAMPHVHATPDDLRRVLVYPIPKSQREYGHRTTFSLIEDDGITLDHERDGKFTEISVFMESFDDRVVVGLSMVHMAYLPLAYDTLWIACGPAEESRPLVVATHDPAAIKKQEFTGEDGVTHLYLGIPLVQ